mgnify:CR=1 FL=1
MMLHCVMGRKIWTNQMKVAKSITESKCVTILDEAFTILCIENYWGKWVNKAGTKWTKSPSGNMGYQGWDKEG